MAYTQLKKPRYTYQPPNPQESQCLEDIDEDEDENDLEDILGEDVEALLEELLAVLLELRALLLERK